MNNNLLKTSGRAWNHIQFHNAYLDATNFNIMENNRKGKLTVRGNGNEDYIKYKCIVCLRADGGCCEVYHINMSNTIERTVGTAPLTHYAQLAQEHIPILCLGRKAWVNSEFVSGVHKKQIVFGMASELLPSITIPRKLAAKIKALLRS